MTKDKESLCFLDELSASPGDMTEGEFEGFLQGSSLLRDALRDQKWVYPELWGVYRHHPDTVYHSIRVAHVLGEMSDGDSTLVLAGLTHDVLKRGVPVRILDKPNQLTEDERIQVQTHVVSYQEDNAVSSNRPDIATINVGHHLYQDNPYPHILVGKHVDSGVAAYRQALAAADQADALLSKRVYKEPWSSSEVKEFLKGKGHLPIPFIEAAVDIHGGLPNQAVIFSSKEVVLFRTSKLPHKA